MKKYAILGLMALTCFSVKAAELELSGIRYAGYTTNAVPTGFSILAVPFSGFDTNSFATTNLSLEALVSTNGLSVGDRLIVFNEATTNYYYYSFTGESLPLSWTNLLVTELGGASTNHVVDAPKLSALTKAQGYAFWLKTLGPRTNQLQGIVNTNVAGVEIAANAMTLVGNALPSPLNLNSVAFTNANNWFTAFSDGVGDTITVVTNNVCVGHVFYGGRWIRTSDYQDAEDIPAGAGVWFLRVGETKTLKLQ